MKYKVGDKVKIKEDYLDREELQNKTGTLLGRDSGWLVKIDDWEYGHNASGTFGATGRCNWWISEDDLELIYSDSQEKRIDWSKEKFIVHLQTKQDWIEVVGWLVDNGWNWCNGYKEISEDWWDKYKEQSCVCLSDESYDSKGYWTEKHSSYPILSPQQFFDKYKIKETLKPFGEQNKPKEKTFMENIVKKIKDLALSKEDRVLRENGFENENGNMTSQAKDMMLDEILEKAWSERRNDVATKLLEIKKEEK